MTLWYIYRQKVTKKSETFFEKHYYRKKLKTIPTNSIFVGKAFLSDKYFNQCAETKIKMNCELQFKEE